MDIKEEIESLVRTTEKNREVLKNSWKKVEDLDAAIQSAKDDQQQRKEDSKSN